MDKGIHKGMGRTMRRGVLLPLILLLVSPLLLGSHRVVAQGSSGSGASKGESGLVDWFIRGGVTFPMQFVMLKESGQVPDKLKTIVGFHVGGGLRVIMPQVPALSMEMSLVFDRKGTRYLNNLGSAVSGKSADPGSAEDMVYRDGYYINLPVHLACALEMMRTGIFISAGPTISWGLVGHSWLKGGSEDFPVFKDGGVLHPFDLSLGVRAGFRVLGVEISGYYDAGIVNISRLSTVKVRNAVGGITLGYLF